MGDMILQRTGGGRPIVRDPPAEVRNLVGKASNTSVKLTWDDPDDIRLDGGTVIKWSYTRIVRKTGSYPVNENDGTVVITNAVRDQYKSEPYIDDNLTKGTTYYYCAFSCSESGVFSAVPAKLTIMTTSYKTMTVTINEADSNPATCCSYADDAVGMPSGKSENAITEWQKFFKYKPCLICRGEVVGYLDPNDYTRFEGGDHSGLTTNDIGNVVYNEDKNDIMDVMIEFPRLGLNISKSGDLITIQITDDPDREGFVYYSYTYDGVPYDHLYIGAFLMKQDRDTGTATSSAISYFGEVSRYCAQYFWDGRSEYLDAISFESKRSDHWFYFTFANYVLIQCMYIMQFKNLNIQSVFDMETESTEDVLHHGMFGMTPSGEYAVRLFGIEAILNFKYYNSNDDNIYLDGFFAYQKKAYIQTDMKPHLNHFGEDKTGYTVVDLTDAGVITEFPRGGTVDWYVRKTAATPLLGFLPTSISGASTTTYYCDIFDSDMEFNNSSGNYWYVINIATSSSSYGPSWPENSDDGMFSGSFMPMNASYGPVGSYGSNEGMLRIAYLK